MTDPPWLKEYEELRRPFAETVARILMPGGFACIYSGHFHLKEFLDVLESTHAAIRDAFDMRI